MCRKIDHLLLVETFNDLRVDKPLCPKCRANLGQCAACEKILPTKHIEKYDNEMCIPCSKKTFVSLSEVQSIFGLTKKDDLKGLGVGDKNAGTGTTVNKMGQQAPKLQLFEQSKVIE